MGRTLLNVWAESRRGKRVDKEHSPVLPANVGEGQAHVTESHTIPRVSPQRRSGWNIELLKSDRDVPLITVVCDNREQVPRIEPLRETSRMECGQFKACRFLGVRRKFPQRRNQRLSAVSLS